MDDQPNVTQRKQSRFRPLHSFSLRTLFVVVTVFACWLGWQAHRIAQRAEARQWIDRRNGVWDSFDDPQSPWKELRLTAGVEKKLREFSIVRQLFRDTPIMLIVLPKGTVTEEEIAGLRALFPEAVVIEVEEDRIHPRPPINSVL